MTLSPDPPTPPVSPSAPLLSLQVLRAVAALSVVVHHAGYDADTIATRTGGQPLHLDRVFDWGFGIHLFFVISGCIMLRTAVGYRSARGAAVFLARRIIRVVPLYWLMTSLVLVGAGLASGLLNAPLGGGTFVLGSYLFVPVTRANGDWHPVLGQGWTLEFEMFFYGLFAASMLLPRRRALCALASALVGLVLLGALFKPDNAALAVWTDGLLLEFLFGMAFGALQPAGRRIPVAASAAAVAAGVSLAVLLGPLLTMGDGLPAVIRGGLPAALIVGGCVLGPRWPRRPAVLALALVGDASYSLYLSHPFVIRVLREAWTVFAPSAAPLPIFCAIAGIAAVAAAIVLHRGVERPMTNWLQRRSRWAGAIGRPILPEVMHARPTPED